jgi:hypothetical protein
MKNNIQETPLEALLTRLAQLLQQYLVEHELELLVSLQQENQTGSYIRQKIASVRELAAAGLAENRPAYVIEALCLEELTRDLRPSRYAYVRQLLAAEFETDYERLRRYGILTYEVINLAGACEPIFEVFQFSEDNEDSPELRCAVSGLIAEYVGR